MAIAVAFRFREREYYQELNTGDELLMGCHKKDTVQIHLLDGTLTAAVTEIQAAEGVKNE